MRETAQRDIPGLPLDLGGARHVTGDAERASEELRGCRRRDILPVDVVLGRAGEREREAQRVGAVLVDLGGECGALAAALGHLLALAEHHALIQQRAERLGEAHVAQVEEHLGDEAGVQQVQDRVLDAADVLVDGRPLLGLRHRERLEVVVRREEAQEVPRAVDERVHGVGVALRGTAVARVGDGHPVGRGCEGRLALRLEIESLGVGKHDRQLIEGHGNELAVGAVDDRDGRAPEALPANQPVAQTVGLRGTTGSGGLELLDDLRDRIVLAEPVDGTRVDHATITGERLAGRDGVGRTLREHLLGDHLQGARDRSRGVDDDPHGQPEGAGEVEVALVMGRNSHNRAVAVVGEDVVRRPDRDALPTGRVDRPALERDARL